MSWICPHCRQRLESVGSAWVCAAGHSFDVAREGYVNLMTGRQKSGAKGDTPAMLAARRRFLEGGYYEPLRRRVTELVAAAGGGMVAEVGCGEGYYLGGVVEQLPGVIGWGTDIAKAGVQLAAKRYLPPRVHFAVCDTNRLVPFADDCVDVLLDVFAPRNGSEFRRVVRPAGRLIVVIPTERHLAQLRAVTPLLAIQADKREAVERTLSGGFALQAAETLTVPLTLAAGAAADLANMTPNAWFLDDAAKARLGDAGPLEVTAEFELLMFG